ncbi:MAG: nucleotidyl transferase AbiEii/AbiGii toxin family protein [Candidatus Margulisbacteria bacterium]|nr:nucleotidyl transferase AbiEii/AbiGii toxin family protein [Candidatus Margulisiibacteriota bacterium]
MIPIRILSFVINHCLNGFRERNEFVFRVSEVIFERAAFYGGTALRLFFGLDRFSENLDFSLLKPDPTFRLDAYHKAVQEELSSYGFKTVVTRKAKKDQKAVQSAFIKTGTMEYDLKIALNPKKTLSIKLEVDTHPPDNFSTDIRYLLNPTDFFVKTYSKQDLFAGKMHALLCRQWKSRVKGRDWYDFIWFCREDIPLHLAHLQARMMQSHHWEKGKGLTETHFKRILKSKIESLNIQNAKIDIVRFIKNPSQLDIWSTDFFLSLIDKINFTS